MRRPDAGVRIARVLLGSPNLPHYGWNLRVASKTRPGLVYPWLTRFMERGWLTDRWETGKARPRRYYLVTPAGRVGLAGFIERNEPDDTPNRPPSGTVTP